MGNKVLANLLAMLVHELEPKKWVFGSGEWAKHNIDLKT